ncbi:ABC transporter ATP-binding protein [Alkalibacter rhizosphaerae]|uniref:ABC transporter ATP-binding protein n=1 Tax=Alkalibacter rhizosphaerae TaxID=2815577 RepID=A0A974XGG3_9FIRM|nr:ABC transporter ATP-binding protein [Alkalibacter rhizosphaerae]QSX09407.1 ABC transporter ATP-binding protein [Alkalibacter rhizosphaerae]
MTKLYDHLKPYAGPILFAIFLHIIRTITELFLPTITADMVNNGITTGNVNYILQLGLLMLGVALLSSIASISANYLSSKAANGFTRDLRQEVFTQVEHFSLHEFDRFGTSSLINRTTNDIAQVRTLLDFGLRMSIIAPIMSIGSVIMAYRRDPGLALVFVVVIPVLALIIIGVVYKGLPLFEAVQKKLDEMNLILRERLSGIRVIRAFHRESVEKERFQHKNTDYTLTSIAVNRIMGAMMPMVTLTMNLAILLIVWFGGFRIMEGHMMVGDLMAFIQYAMQVMSALILLTRVFLIIPKAMTSWGRVGQILDTVPEITDPQTPLEPEAVHGHVRFDKVDFYYPGAEFPALSGISFEAKPGETTAIIGSTGSGKTTLASLLLRHYDPTSGSIQVDGVDIRDMKQETLRSQVGYTAQRTLLFSGSIRENLLWGKEDATDEELEDACRIAQAKEFIDRLQEGYDHQLSQGAKNLSGGQKQRLAMARALVGKTPILLFDDSFSALDYTTEARLRLALAQEMSDRTLLVISQRINTVMEADQILVMDTGRIVGQGTHEELLKTNPVYQEIVASQLNKEEIA